MSALPENLPAGSAARRRRIVDAALHLFSETDYGAVQMDDVAHLAGVAKPTLYRYFPTKEALFLEGIERLLSQLQHDVEAAEQAPVGADEALRAVIGHVFAILAQCTAAIHAFDGGENQIGERGRSVIRSRVRSIRGVFEQILGAVRMSAAHATSRKRSQALRALITFVESGVADPAGRSLAPDRPAPRDHHLSREMFAQDADR